MCELTNNLKYLETEKLNLMMTVEVDSIASNFSYELELKSNLDSIYEYNLNLNF